MIKYIIPHLNDYARENLKLLLLKEAEKDVYNLKYMEYYKSQIVLCGAIDYSVHKNWGRLSNMRVIETPFFRDCEEEMIYTGSNWEKFNPSKFAENYNKPIEFNKPDRQGNLKFRDLRFIYVHWDLR